MHIKERKKKLVRVPTKMVVRGSMLLVIIVIEKDIQQNSIGMDKMCSVVHASS